MPLTNTATGPIKNYPPSSNVDKKVLKDALALIDTIQFADVGRGAGTARKSTLNRIDVQGQTSSKTVNLQVQVNKQPGQKPGGSTIASVLVDDSVLQIDQQGDVAQQEQNALHHIKTALTDSLNNEQQYTVKGTP